MSLCLTGNSLIDVTNKQLDRPSNFRQKAERSGRYNHEEDERFTEQWSRIIMHLPYAYQAKRMFPDVFRHDREDTEMWADVAEHLGPAPEPHNSDDP